MEQNLSTVIADLDRRIPKEGARVRLYQYGGGADESALLATPGGYLRFGVEMLKAASAPPANPKYPRVIEVDLEYLFDDTTSVYVNLFERADSLDEPAPAPLTGFDRLVPMLIVAFLGVGVVLSFIGLGTVISWLF